MTQHDRMSRIALLVLPLAFAAVLLARGAEGQEIEQVGDLDLTSTAFAPGGEIPSVYGCRGADLNPPLAIRNVPAEARSLAIIMDDPDAPGGIWVHWVLWNIDPSVGAIAEASSPDGAVKGKNDFPSIGYQGPCPPNGRHRYYFKLYALDTALDVRKKSRKSKVEAAMQGHVLGQTFLMGTYQ